MFWSKQKSVANVIEDKCRNCGRCVRVCRHNVLKAHEVLERTITCVHRPERCTGCGKCAAVCPEKAIELITI